LAANCPGVPLKNIAAMGGAITISTDMIKLTPPC